MKSVDAIKLSSATYGKPLPISLETPISVGTLVFNIKNSFNITTENNVLKLSGLTVDLQEGWNFIAGTLNNGTLTLYLGNKSVGTIKLNEIVSLNLTVGNFNGALSNFKLYNYVLTMDEITNDTLVAPDQLLRNKLTEMWNRNGCTTNIPAEYVNSWIGLLNSNKVSIVNLQMENIKKEADLGVTDDITLCYGSKVLD